MAKEKRHKLDLSLKPKHFITNPTTRKTDRKIHGEKIKEFRAILPAILVLVDSLFARLKFRYIESTVDRVNNSENVKLPLAYLGTSLHMPYITQNCNIRGDAIQNPSL